MGKINKYNEFINNEEQLIYQLIEEAENTNSSDLEFISNRESYQNVIKIGEKVIPILLKRNLIIWDKGLSEITGEGLNSLEHDTSERKEFWKNWSKENGF